MSEAGAALVWCPFPDAASAEVAAGILLDERLIACANILPAMRSVYLWQGQREVGEEVGVVFKTTAARLEAVVARVCTLHPYETPAVIGWRCDEAAPATLSWLQASVLPPA
jgi:periplasmic divalent cation tolerance protein